MKICPSSKFSRARADEPVVRISGQLGGVGWVGMGGGLLVFEFERWVALGVPLPDFDLDTIFGFSIKLVWRRRLRRWSISYSLILLHMLLNSSRREQQLRKSCIHALTSPTGKVLARISAWKVSIPCAEHTLPCRALSGWHLAALGSSLRSRSTRHPLRWTQIAAILGG